MPLPIIDNDNGPDQTDLDIRNKEIKERLDRALKNETIENMVARYYEYLERDGEI